MRHVMLLVVLLFSGSAMAQRETPMRFMLDWRFQGQATPYLVALDKGYYKAEGLDVIVDPGAGSVVSINRVASGAYDVGVADLTSLIRYRGNPENLAVTGVMVLYDSSAHAIVSLKKSGIRTPKDLEGRVLGAPANDGAWAQWPLFVRANRINAARVKIVDIPFQDPRNSWSWARSMRSPDFHSRSPWA